MRHKSPNERSGTPSNERHVRAAGWIISFLIGHPLLEFIAMEPISYISDDEGRGGNNGGAYYPQQQLQQSQDFLNQIVQTLCQANTPPDALPPFQTIKGGISIKVADSRDEEIWIRLAPACASP